MYNFKVRIKTEEEFRRDYGEDWMKILTLGWDDSKNIFFGQNVDDEMEDVLKLYAGLIDDFYITKRICNEVYYLWCDKEILIVEQNEDTGSLQST